MENTVLRSSLESGRQAAKSLGDKVLQFMNTMATAGMGADASPPESSSQCPALPAIPAIDHVEEEMNDYRADDEDEDEDEDEIDNSVDYVPIKDLCIDSESSESIGGDESEKDDGTGQQESVKQVFLGLIGDVSMETRASTAEDGAVEKVDVEHHAAVQDTTAVKKYSHTVAEEGLEDETSDKEKEKNKLMAVTLSKSSAVIDRMTSSTLTADTTKLLSDDSSSSITDESDSEDQKKIKASGKSKVTTSPHDGDDKMPAAEQKPEELEDKVRSPPLVEKGEQTADLMEVEPQEDLVSETPPSVDAAHEADVAVAQQQDGQTAGSDPPKSPARQPSARSKKGKLNSMTTKTKSAKRKQGLPPSSDLAAKKENNGGHTSPAKTIATPPVQTPKRLKRASSKKKKQSPATLEANDHSMPLRRSSRVKVEPPKFTYPAKRLEDETVMTHFTRMAGTAGSPPTPVMACKYCGKQVTTSRGSEERHLNSCKAFERDGQATPQPSDVVVKDDNEEKATPPSRTAAVMKNVKPEAGTQPTSANDLATTLVHLMGTETLAAKIKDAFESVSFAGNAPISRFQDLIRDDVTGLRHLHVLNLLEAVNTLDGPILQLHTKLSGVRRTTGHDQVEPVSKAKARALEKCCLCFPTPRMVAEQFIVPLAKELGLEYAMRQHTAHLVSCPQDGALLDWRFRKTETVVFQLGGKATWTVKMSQVKHPLQSFEPESWLMDAVAQVAKVHRVVSMDNGGLGFLAPPSEDFDVFDENNGRDNVDSEQQEYVLKPGSVVYVPGGAWFEVETQGANALWLEVQLASMTYVDLAFSALKQLAWGDKQWRMKMQIYPGNRARTKATRHHVEACIKSLRTEMVKLEGSDILPEYLCTGDMQDLIAQGLIHDTSSSPDSMSIEMDLTNPRLKLKHEKVFKNAAYRVNPVALLMSAEEIPHVPVEVNEGQAPGQITTQTPQALKKTTKPHPKRKQALRVLTGKHTYMLDEMFGNADFRSHLHAKLHFSAEQSRMVEWLRARGEELFDLEEFSSCDSSLLQGKSPARCKKIARNLLRFLCFVGYVTQVKAP